MSKMFLFVQSEKNHEHYNAREISEGDFEWLKKNSFKGLVDLATGEKGNVFIATVSTPLVQVKLTPVIETPEPKCVLPREWEKFHLKS